MALVRQLAIHGTQIKALVYESGPIRFDLARTCQSTGIPAIGAAPSRIVRPVSPTAKTDGLDCRKLAIILWPRACEVRACTSIDFGAKGFWRHSGAKWRSFQVSDAALRTGRERERDTQKNPQ